MELATLAGQRFTLRRAGRRAADAGLDFSGLRAAHRPAAGLDALIEEIRAHVNRRDGWGEIAGAPGTGATTALCAALDALEADGWVVLQHFYGRGPAWWDDVETVFGSLVAQLRAAVPDLPALDAISLPSGVRSNVGKPGAALEVLLTASAERDGPRVVVAFDEPPAGNREELKRWAFATPVPSLVPPRSSFLAAGPHVAGIRDFLEDGDPHWRVVLGGTTAETVCRAYLRSHWQPVLAALGLPAAPVVALSGRGLGGGADARPARARVRRGPRRGRGSGAVARCDAGVIVLDAEPDEAQLAFGLGCRERGIPLVVVMAGEDASFEGSEAVAGGRLEIADRILGRDLGAGDPDAAARVADELAQRLSALVWSFAGELIALAGGAIGRLRPLVDWLAAQPPGSADLERLPASLAGALPWDELSELALRHAITVVAVAQPGLLVRDVLWATPPDAWPPFLAALRRLGELHLLADPSGRLPELLEDDAREPGAWVEALGTTPLRSADPGLAEQLRPVFLGGLEGAHQWLAEAQGERLGEAPEYFARHGMAHAVAGGDAELVRRLCGGPALTRRARRLGVAAVAADLALARTLVDDRVLATVHEAVLTLAARAAPVAEFPRLLHHELMARLGAIEATRHLHPNEAMRPLLEGVAEPLADDERASRFVDVAALLELSGGVAAASRDGVVRVLSGREWSGDAPAFAPEAALVGLPGPRIAGVTGRGVTLAAPDGERTELDVPPGRLDLSWAGRAGDDPLAASADGALLHWPRGAASARVLLAHTGAVTCAATGSPAVWQRLARDAVVQILVGDEVAGHGIFVDDGVLLADGAAGVALAEAEGAEARIRADDLLYPAEVIHREKPGELTLLRTTLEGRAVVPLAGTGDPGELRLDRHDVEGPTLVGGRTLMMLRRRDEKVLGAAAARRAFVQDGLGGFVFDRGCLYAVVVSQQDASMVAAEPAGGLESRLGGDRAGLRALLRAGTWFATGSEDGTVAVWTTDAEAPLLRYRGHGAAVRTLTTMGRFIASGGDDGTMRLWAAASGRDVAVLGTGAAATASADAGDGCVAWGAADGALGVWDPRSVARSERFTGHAARVTGLTIHENSVISWAADGSVASWSRGERDPVGVLRGPAPARHVARLMWPEVAVLWGDDSVTVEQSAGAGQALTCLAVSPDGEQVAHGAGDALVVRALRPGRRVWGGPRTQPGVPDRCTFAQVSPKELVPCVLTGADREPDGLRWWGSPPTSLAAVGRLVAVGLADGTLTLREAPDITRPPGTALSESGAATVLSVAGGATRPEVLSGHADGTVRHWALAPEPQLRSRLVQEGPATHVALAGHWAASADGDLVRVWDLDKREAAGVLAGHSGPITGIAPVPGDPADGDRLATCSQDGTVCLWDLTTLHRLETFRGPHPFVALAAGGRTLAARDGAGKLYLWVRAAALSGAPDQRRRGVGRRRLGRAGRARAPPGAVQRRCRAAGGRARGQGRRVPRPRGARGRRSALRASGTSSTRTAGSWCRRSSRPASRSRCAWSGSGTRRPPPATTSRCGCGCGRGSTENRAPSRRCCLPDDRSSRRGDAASPGRDDDRGRPPRERSAPCPSPSASSVTCSRSRIVRTTAPSTRTPRIRPRSSRRSSRCGRRRVRRTCWSCCSTTLGSGAPARSADRARRRWRSGWPGQG